MDSYWIVLQYITNHIQHNNTSAWSVIYILHHIKEIIHDHSICHKFVDWCRYVEGIWACYSGT